MGKKVAQNSHEVPELKSFKPWRSGMKVKRRVLVRNQETGETVKDENGNSKYEIEYQPISADKKSQMNHLYMSSKTQRFWGVLWNQADKCQLFRQKVPKVQNADGTWVYRTYPKTDIPIVDRGNRALSGHTLKTLASGAVATVNAQMHADALTLRLQTKKGDPLAPEDTKYPMLPTYSVGAAYAIEAAFIAYVQEIFSTALEIQGARQDAQQGDGQVLPGGGGHCEQAALRGDRLRARDGELPQGAEAEEGQGGRGCGGGRQGESVNACGH